MSLSAKTFISEATVIFSFLTSKGYKMQVGGTVRDETSLSYCTEKLMFLIQYCSTSDDVWCVVGQPCEHYPKKAVSLMALLEHVGGITLVNQRRSAREQLSNFADLIKRHLGAVLDGDLSLLERIWFESDSEEEKLIKYQRSIAINIALIGSAEVLELPNTIDALGADYAAKNPGHVYEGSVWLVVTQIAQFVCQDREQAIEQATMFG